MEEAGDLVAAVEAVTASEGADSAAQEAGAKAVQVVTVPVRAARVMAGLAILISIIEVAGRDGS